jgi:hypothetical protein
VADVPDKIVLTRHRDLTGRKRHPWVRRLLLALLTAFLVVALFNVFGQRPATTRASTSAATLSVYSPLRVRGGLMFTTRFHITAHRDVNDARLVLDPGWIEGMQVNSMNPQPINEGSRNGWIVLDLGHIPAGGSYILFVEFQVNPTNVGHRSQTVELYDGQTRLLTIHRTITIFP